MLAATVVALLALPVAAPALALSDLVRGRGRLPRLRVYLFACQYLINDSVEIVLVPLYWLRAGLGTTADSAVSLARHRRLQWWSLDVLTRRADRLLGLRLEIDERSKAAVTPGPVVVISRHVSLFDPSLPGLICRDQGLAVRGVIMAELLADPGFDLLYSRLGSVFIPRDDGPAARTAIEAMTRSMQRHDGDEAAVVIFPEGRLFRPSVRNRSLERLTRSDPERAARLAGLTNLLPPRPGGLRCLLDVLAEADVVLLDHRGLDGLGRLTALADLAPIDGSIRVMARRIPRSEIPDDPEAFTAWLDQIWLDLDAGLERDAQPAGSRLREAAQGRQPEAGS